MLFYMIRDKKSGLYYRDSCQPCWVEQEKAWVWTRRPEKMRRSILWRNRPSIHTRLSVVYEPEIITFTASANEQPNPQWVQCASKPDCCPITPDDKRHEELPSID